ncbi:MAG: tetratricopeptide repeat protein [Alphaproteobacteria bacterium]|nr:tetratricopeptide repeat protein [Alphaproteobacteria bacterium]
MSDPDPRDRLAELVATCGDTLPPDLGCALIAADEQGLSADHADATLAALDALGERLHLPARCSPYEAIARLNHFLFTDQGFTGDIETFDDPQNSYLDCVLTRRRGLPILLSVLYISLARRKGFAIDGVGFPGHFLVSPAGVEPRFFVDPFHSGQVLPEEGMRRELVSTVGDLASPRQIDGFLKPTPPRLILVRVMKNLQLSHVRRSAYGRALQAIDRLLILGPEFHDERRRRGLLLDWLERTDEAIAAYEDYLTHVPDAPDADRVRASIHRLRTELT